MLLQVVHIKVQSPLNDVTIVLAEHRDQAAMFGKDANSLYDS